MTDRAELLINSLGPDGIVCLLKAVNKHLDPKAAAIYLNVSIRCLEDWRKRGTGPPWKKVGRRVLYRFADLDAYLARGSQGTRTAPRSSNAAGPCK